MAYLYCPPLVDRLWGIWESRYDIPQATFCLLQGEYNHGISNVWFPIAAVCGPFGIVIIDVGTLDPKPHSRV